MQKFVSVVKFAIHRKHHHVLPVRHAMELAKYAIHVKPVMLAFLHVTLARTVILLSVVHAMRFAKLGAK
jgi:hypothetical protein